MQLGWWTALGLMMVGLVGMGETTWGAESKVGWVYFGTYTGGTSEGIYRSRFDFETGVMGPPELAARAENPSFLVLQPGGRRLYGVLELAEYEGRPGGAVAGWELEPETGALQAINAVSSGGMHPCHLTMDAKGRWVLAANYSSGNLAVLPVREDGSLGSVWQMVQHVGSSVHPQRQKGPHAHSIQLDAANRMAVAADLGLDRLMVYRFEPATGSLEAHDPPFAVMTPGSGPRHTAFHPRGRHLLAINELNSTLTLFRYDRRRGILEAAHTVKTIPDSFEGSSSTAEVRVHPSGRWVYGSNRGHDSLAVFRVDTRRHRLELVEWVPAGGRTPRNFAIDPSGRWLVAAHQGSDSVGVFRIDPGTGKLKETGGRITVGSPVCVLFVR